MKTVEELEDEAFAHAIEVLGLEDERPFTPEEAAIVRRSLAYSAYMFNAHMAQLVEALAEGFRNGAAQLQAFIDSRR